MALNDSLRNLSLALPLAGAALLADEAEACSPDPCWYVDTWQDIAPINAASIPTDGVLLLQGAQSGNSPDEDWLASVDLTVTLDGQPIAGALETSGVNDVLVWRPAAPLEPGATYKVIGSLDNPDVEPYYENCGPDILLLDFEFHADLGPAAPLTPPKASAEESVLVTPEDGLEDLVCCDGAMPFESYYDCGGYGEYVTWSEGFCTSLRGFGTLRVQVAVESELPPATAAMVSRQLFVDGQPAGTNFAGTLPASGAAPFCTSVQLRSLASGETVMSEEQCHGAGVVDQLGDQAIDPSAELGQQCSTEAYVCQLVPAGDKWDETQCSAWPGGVGTTGDSTGDPTGDPTSDGTTSDGPTSDGPTSDGPTSAGPTSAGPGTDGPGTGEDTSATGPDSGGQDGLVDHGCACTSGTPDPLALFGLFSLGLLRRRRRRR